MRLFIAARINKEIEREVGEFLEQFHRLPGRIKWVEPHNIHITLKFLGETDSNEVEPLKQAIAHAAAKTGAFEAHLQGCGVFPNMRAPRVFWIGINDPQKRLTTLAAKVDSELTTLGFDPEQRAFSPHLTLGRVKDDDNLEAVKAAFVKATFGPLLLRVEKIHLVESQLKPSGPVYKDIAGFEL